MRNLVALTVIAMMSSVVIADETGMMRLAGTPEQIGTQWGTLHRETIQQDIASSLAKAKKAGITREIIIERSAAFREIAGKIAPHWIEEARATARAAGVDEELYVALLDGESRNRYLHECTSYAVPKEHTRDGMVLFHKNRDNTDRPQVAPMVESSLDGIHKFIAVSNVGPLRCSMMVNEKGLAGSGDYPAEKKKDSSTLTLPSADPQYRGIMAGTILRYIAERASTSEEALAIIEDFVSKGYYAGGDVNGSHWLFADRNGVIIEVCNNSRHVVSKVHTQKAYFSRLNNSAAAKKLRGEKQPVDFQTFHNVSRDRSICFRSSISGMTVEIDPDHPELLTCAWIALPARTVAFPVFIGQSHIPTCLADGTANQLGKASPDQINRWEAIEKGVYADKAKLREELISSIEAGNPHGAHVEAIDDWSRDHAQKIMKALAQPE